jgi:hypothetical protein
MSTKHNPRQGARPPGRTRRLTRLALFAIISIVTGIAVGTWGSNHLATVAGITLALFPLLLMLLPGRETAPATPPSDLPYPPAMPSPALLPSPAASAPPPQPDRDLSPANPAPPTQADSQATRGHEINLGTYTPPPVTLRLTVKPTLNLEAAIDPVMNLQAQQPHTDHENA